MTNQMCPRCRSLLEQSVIHCSVCGYGNIQYSNTPNQGKVLPDQLVNDCRQLILLCDALMKRFKEQINHIEELNRYQPGSINISVNSLSAEQGKFIRDFFPNQVHLSEWIPFTNLNTITDLMCMSTEVYLHIFNQLGNFGMGKITIDGISDIHQITKLPPLISKNVEMSIYLLKSYLKQVITVDEKLHYFTYPYWERYYINGFSLGLKVLQFHTDFLKSNDGNMTENRRKNLDIAINLLESACQLKEKGVRNVLGEAKELYQNSFMLAEYMSELTTFLFPSFARDANFYINFYDRIDYHFHAEINNLDTRSMSIYDIERK